MMVMLKYLFIEQRKRVREGEGERPHSPSSPILDLTLESWGENVCKRDLINGEVVENVGWILCVDF